MIKNGRSGWGDGVREHWELCGRHVEEGVIQREIRSKQLFLVIRHGFVWAIGVVGVAVRRK